MNSRKSDRRKANRDIQFPMTDSAGYYIGADRRSGMDRRNKDTDSIALNITSLINT